MVRRYHWFLVLLHWLIAIVVIQSLLFANFVLVAYDNEDPAKLQILLVHMAAGLLALALMIIRLVVRQKSEHPRKAETGNGLLNRLGSWTHWAFYLAVIAMGLTGLGMAQMSDLFAIVFQESGAPLPASFDILPTNRGHKVISQILIGLIGLHLVAAVYHQFIRRDNLLARMWFGKR